MEMHRSTRVSLWLVLCVLAMAGAAPAQIQTGNIIGTVRDESGAILPGATVTLTSPALPAGPLTFVTNQSGEYRFALLEPGTYSLSVALAGFSAYQEEGLRVSLSGTIERNVGLKLAAVAETITVSGESPMVDARRVGTAKNIGREVLEILPVHRQYMTEYTKLSPGVSPSDPSGQSTNTSIMGSTLDENTFLYDGTNADRPTTGAPFSSGDLDAVEEVQIFTLGASAEYQVAQGGVINVVFKQGTNDWKFDASAFSYPDWLLSKPIKANCRCPRGETGYTSVVNHNYSGHIGGPIKRDRLWFYGGGNFDARILAPPGSDPDRLKEDMWWYSHATASKLTWQINDKLKFRQTWNTDPYGGQGIPSVSRPFETQASNYGFDQVYGSELNVTLSSNTLLTGRVTGWYALHYPRKPLTGDRISPIRIDQLTGIACCGVDNFNDQGVGRHGQSVKINRYIQGRNATHDLRFGVQLEWAHYQAFSALPSGVNYSDIGGQPDQATFRDAWVQGGAYRSQAVWGEDQVTFFGRLTLSLGMRFDRMRGMSEDLPVVNNLLQKTGSTVQGLGEMQTWTVVSPRVGFNFKLSDDGKAILRGNYGRGYRQVYIGDFENVHPGISPITLARFNPATGGFTTIVSVTHPTANIAFDRDLEAPYTDQYSIGMDRELMPNVGLGVTYVHKRGTKSIGWTDIGGVYGTRTETLPDGRTITVYPLLNSPSERRFLRTNGTGTFTRYNGLLVGLEKRWAQRWQGSFAYTFSRAKGRITSGQDPNDDINADGLLALDRPHIIAAVATYEIPKIAVQVSTNFMRATGNSVAPQALVQLPQGRRSVNIEPSNGTYRLPSQELLHLRLGKILFRRGDKRLDLGAEIWNLLQDTANNAILTQNFFSPTFLAAGDWIEPRRMNFVVRAWF
jgi:hypothetical protein